MQLQVLTPAVVSVVLLAVQAWSKRFHRQISNGVTTYRFPPPLAVMTMCCGIVVSFGLAFGNAVDLTTVPNDASGWQRLCGWIVVNVIYFGSVIGLSYYSVTVYENGISFGVFSKRTLLFDEIERVEMASERRRTIVLYAKSGKHYYFFYPLEDLDLLCGQLLSKLEQA